MKSFLIILLLLSSVATADEIVINLKSYHINSVYAFNEDNLGLGYRDTDRNIEYGIFRNSYYKTDSIHANGFGYSVYLKGSAYNKPINKYLVFNIDMGVAVYGNDGSIPFVPIVQPMLILKPVKQISINVGYMPLFVEVETDDGTEKSDMYGILTLSTSYLF